FILELFPSTPFYATLLPPEVAAQIGQVHAETVPALRLLERAGLRFIDQIDPFDAGPFYGAPFGDVVPVRETIIGRLDATPPPDGAVPAILCAFEDGFRAVAVPCERAGDVIRAPKDAQRRLGLREGDAVAWTPLPISGESGATARGG